MQIKFLATANAPDFYEFDGDFVTAYYNNQSDTFDFSNLQNEDKFEGTETDLGLSNSHIIRNAERDENGELHVTLCKKAPKGHWRESDWLDANDYDADKRYIKEVTSDG